MRGESGEGRKWGKIGEEKGRLAQIKSRVERLRLIIFKIVMSKAQLLQVQYKQDQGLTFQWNYADVSTDPIYFRHVICLYTENLDEANLFLKTYLKKIKPGDFYYIIYFSPERQLKHLGWKEKPVVDDHPNEKPIIRKNTTKGNKELMLSEVQKFYGDFSEPIVLSILSDSVQDKEELEQIIIKARNNEKYDFMVAFFSPTPNSSFSLNHAITNFSTVGGDCQNYLEFFLNQVYQASMLSAKLTIECLNGSITSMADSNWRTTAFNTIERMFYGPSLKYEKDILCIYNRTRLDCHQELSLKLEFVTLQRRKFRNEKVISVHFNREFYQNTFNMYSWTKSYHTGKDIWLTENPFTTFTVIKFQSNIDLGV